MTTDKDEARRQELAETAAALAAEVSQLSEHLVNQNVRIAELTGRNDALSERSKTHSAWIFGTVAGLVLDLILTIVVFVFFDRQQETNTRLEATQARLEKSISNQCGFLALAIGSYRPESRPPEGREEYEKAFRLMRDQYRDLNCSAITALVPPAIQK